MRLLLAAARLDAGTSELLATYEGAAPLPATGLPVWDQALGGFAPGLTVLLAGEPGAGKTTLALQLAEHIGPTLFASSEEDGDRVKAHWSKLRLRSDRVRFLYEGDLTRIVAEAARLDPRPRLLVINSLHTTTDTRPAASPSPTPWRAHASSSPAAVCRRLVAWTRSEPTMSLIVGHLTWDNRSAGPRMIEHEVDAVAYLTILKQGEHAGRRQLELRKGRPPFRGTRAAYPVPDWEPADGQA